MNFKILSLSGILLITWFFLTNANRNPNNPPTGKTGAPGENTCAQTDCHSGGNFTGTVTISGIPDTVMANQTYSLTLTNASNATRAGFQMTCWDASNAMCGTFTALLSSGVNIGSGAAGKKYPRQSSPKTLSNGSASWTFSWKAPAAASGNVAKFYFVSLCANGNGNNSGDNVLQASKTVVLQTTSPSWEAESEVSLKFFPTLVRDNALHIELLKDSEGELWVYDVQGKVVLQRKLSASNQLNVEGLPPGAYAALIRVGSKSVAKKFVVE